MNCIFIYVVSSNSLRLNQINRNIHPEIDSISDLFVNHVLRFAEGFPANPHTHTFVLYSGTFQNCRRERVTKVVETELTSERERKKVARI